MRLNVKFVENDENIKFTSAGQDESIPVGFLDVNTVTVTSDYNRLINKPIINSVVIQGALTAEDLGLGRVYYDTTAAWDAQPTLVAERSVIYIYSDATWHDDGNGNQIPIAGLKIGDGTSYLIDMPFVSDTTSENNKRYIQNMWTFSGNDDTECMLWWTIIRNNNDLKYMPVLNNISLDEVNFDKYNVVICINRKINKICYHKEPQFPFIPKTPTTATIHFNVHEELNTIFVYLIKKEEPLRVDYKLPMKSQCIID